jgi:hypothetical protein
MTKTTYEEVTDDFGGVIIKRTNADNSVTWIPADPANSDYQRYLRWLENPDAEENGTIS